MKKLFQSLVAILVIGALTYAAIHFTEGVQQEPQRFGGSPLRPAINRY